jgi:elongation factor P--(R)-beta-lysine ligase
VLRGRVIAVDDGGAWLRTQAGERRVAATGARPGDLVEVDGGALRVVRAAPAGWPAPGSEVTRLPRPRLDALAARGRALAAVRAYLAGEGFLEIEAPVRIKAPALELHLDAIRCDGGFLATSPEYQMKRLLAGGLERIYALGKCLRGGERGPQHNPEFTLLEWYRAWDGWEAVLADTEAIVSAIVRAVTGGTTTIERAGRPRDLAPPWPRMTVADAMARHAGVAVAGAEDAAELAARVRAAGVEIGGATAWDDVFFCAFLERVEPALAARDTPVVLIDWPAPLGALARRRADDPRVVERFEVYVAGLELCNGFGELTCPVEQRARFEAEQAARAAGGKPVHPIDERLLAALTEGIPPSGGNALGIDRVLMLATGATDIKDVLPFADEEL